MKKIILVIIVALYANAANAQWQNSNIPNLGYPNSVTCVVANGPNIFVAVYGWRIYFSNNNGSSWTPVNTGLTDSTEVTSLAISGTNIFAGTGGGVFLSTNNGSSWTAVNTGLTYLHVSCIAISGSNIFVGTNGGGVFMSTNNGGLWTSVNTGLSDHYISSIAINGSNIFAGVDYNGGGVFLSTNNGGLWTRVNNGLTDTTIISLAVSGSTVYAGTDTAIFLSTNNGGLWTNISNGLTNIQNVWVIDVIGTNIFAGTWYGGVYLSTNNGGLWTKVNTGLTDTNVVSFALSGTTLFAAVADPGNEGGVWQRPLSEMTGIAELQKETTITIAPNPFTSQTVITFSEEQKNTVLYIRDVVGREINSQQVTGNSAVLDMSGFAKGIYFVQLMDEKKNVINKKIVVE